MQQTIENNKGVQNRGSRGKEREIITKKQVDTSFV